MHGKTIFVSHENAAVGGTVVPARRGHRLELTELVVDGGECVVELTGHQRRRRRRYGSRAWALKVVNKSTHWLMQASEVGTSKHEKVTRDRNTQFFTAVW